MENSNKPETEEDGIRAEALRRLKVRLPYEALPAQTREFPLVLPIDQESSLFVNITTEQHQKMVQQLRREFMAKNESSPKKMA